MPKWIVSVVQLLSTFVLANCQGDIKVWIRLYISNYVGKLGLGILFPTEPARMHI